MSGDKSRFEKMRSYMRDSAATKAAKDFLDGDDFGVIKAQTACDIDTKIKALINTRRGDNEEFDSFITDSKLRAVPELKESLSKYHLAYLTFATDNTNSEYKKAFLQTICGHMFNAGVDIVTESIKNISDESDIKPLLLTLLKNIKDVPSTSSTDAGKKVAYLYELKNLVDEVLTNPANYKDIPVILGKTEIYKTFKDDFIKYNFKIKLKNAKEKLAPEFYDINPDDSTEVLMAHDTAKNRFVYFKHTLYYYNTKSEIQEITLTPQQIKEIDQAIKASKETIDIEELGTKHPSIPEKLKSILGSSYPKDYNLALANETLRQAERGTTFVQSLQAYRSKGPRPGRVFESLAKSATETLKKGPMDTGETPITQKEHIARARSEATREAFLRDNSYGIMPKAQSPERFGAIDTAVGIIGLEDGAEYKTTKNVCGFVYYDRKPELYRGDFFADPGNNLYVYDSKNKKLYFLDRSRLHSLVTIKREVEVIGSDLKPIVHDKRLENLMQKYHEQCLVDDEGGSEYVNKNGISVNESIHPDFAKRITELTGHVGDITVYDSQYKKIQFNELSDEFLLNIKKLNEQEQGLYAKNKAVLDALHELGDTTYSIQTLPDDILGIDKRTKILSMMNRCVLEGPSESLYAQRYLRTKHTVFVGPNFDLEKLKNTYKPLSKDDKKNLEQEIFFNPLTKKIYYVDLDNQVHEAELTKSLFDPLTDPNKKLEELLAIKVDENGVGSAQKKYYLSSEEVYRFITSKVPSDKTDAFKMHTALEEIEEVIAKDTSTKFMIIVKVIIAIILAAYLAVAIALLAGGLTAPAGAFLLAFFPKVSAFVFGFIPAAGMYMAAAAGFLYSTQSAAFDKEPPPELISLKEKLIALDAPAQVNKPSSVAVDGRQRSNNNN
jgi:hypothetical protein